ncbi:glycoside hydrolase domain-containing protein [Bacillus sp. USDA818B3_A]|uniref:glycoside hydrolase domain-containing protein n=1 Tax=Bacillus sp. USDA818B3_A TaxID=2698834 RepID=UPI001369BDA3|nr:glycoside hydrolase domain-containing protein [Bacillus sp. USDA818B3_A]
MYKEHQSKETASHKTEQQKTQKNPQSQKPSSDPPENQPQQKPDSPPPQDEPSKKPEANKPDPSKVYWGIDTADAIDQTFYQCVAKNYGKPDVVGRYIGHNEGASTGLTKEEIDFLKKQGVKIIPIYNHFTDATGYEHGVEEAKAAIALAKELDIPDGIVIYADIEPTYPVDAEFIRGWTETISSSQYKPGIYGVFEDGKELSNAYIAAIDKNKDFKNKILIWTSNPEVGKTGKDKAPKYNPQTPKGISAAIWQYGLEGKQCNIDTNLIQAPAYSASW